MNTYTQQQRNKSTILAILMYSSQENRKDTLDRKRKIVFIYILLDCKPKKSTKKPSELLH